MVDPGNTKGGNMTATHMKTLEPGSSHCNTWTVYVSKYCTPKPSYLFPAIPLPSSSFLTIHVFKLLVMSLNTAKALGFAKLSIACHLPAWCYTQPPPFILQVVSPHDSSISPFQAVTSTSHWTETLGQYQDLLDRLCLTVSLGISEYPQEELKVWTDLLAVCCHYNAHELKDRCVNECSCRCLGLQRNLL